MQITANGIRLEFPKEIDPGTITGELTLLRPNNPTLDKTIAVMASSDGIFEIEGDLLAPGRYNALLEWKAGESAYYSEQSRALPCTGLACKAQQHVDPE